LEKKKKKKKKSKKDGKKGQREVVPLGSLVSDINGKRTYGTLPKPFLGDETQEEF